MTDETTDDLYETYRRFAPNGKTSEQIVQQLMRFWDERVIEYFDYYFGDDNIRIRYQLAPGLQPTQIRLEGMPTGTKKRNHVK